MRTKREGTEAHVQDTIRAMMLERGIRSQKIPGSALLKGHPDLLCGCPETGMFYIEVKRPGGKLRESQVTWMELWDKSAHVYVIDRPSKLWDTLLVPRIGPMRLAPNSWRWAAPKGPKLKDVIEEWAS